MNDFMALGAAWCAAIIEGIGVSIITLFAVFSLYNAAVKLLKKEESDLVFHELRQLLGRGILLGLEFLIAADIIYTVAVELTFQTVGVLAMVVLIRTFLSLTMEVEMSGKWPWQSKQ